MTLINGFVFPSWLFACLKESPGKIMYIYLSVVLQIGLGNLYSFKRHSISFVSHGQTFQFSLMSLLRRCVFVFFFLNILIWFNVIVQFQILIVMVGIHSCYPLLVLTIVVFSGHFMFVRHICGHLRCRLDIMNVQYITNYLMPSVSFNPKVSLTDTRIFL